MPRVASRPRRLAQIVPIAVLLAATVLHAQDSQPRRYSVRGTVVNAQTGELIRRALVQFANEAQLTDNEGRFEFNDLPEMELRPMVRKPGFISEDELATRNAGSAPPELLHVSANMSSVVLKLIPEGILTGQILDDNREPLEGAPVRAFAREIVNGRVNWRQAGGAQSDEDGQFRIPDLPPGLYYLCAGPLANMRTELRLGHAEGYAASYYPGAPDRSGAAPIRVPPGQTLDLRLTLPRQPVFEVRGTLRGLPQRGGANVHLFSRTDDDMNIGASVNSQTGEFRVPVVPAGQYMVVAESSDGRNAIYGAAPVEVEKNISDFSLALAPTASVQVDAQIETTKTSAGRSGPVGHLQFVSKEPWHNSRFLDLRPGTRPLDNIQAGTYAVDLAAYPPWYVKSATSGTTDLLRDEFVVVVSGRAIQPISIVLRDDSATLSVTLTSDVSRAAGTVLMFADNAPPQGADGWLCWRARPVATNGPCARRLHALRLRYHRWPRIRQS